MAKANSKYNIAFIGISFIIVFPFLCAVPPSHAEMNIPQSNYTTFFSPQNICKDTPFPSSCLSTLPNRSTNVYDLCRLSFKRSLSRSYNFLNLIEHHLRNSSNLPKPTIQAIEDCHILASLNVEFLSTSYGAINKTSKILTLFEAHTIQTKLSAALTNLQTCSEGLEPTYSDGPTKNDILGSISNSTQQYSVSLSLFTKGWVPTLRPSPRQPKNCTSGDGRLPLRMSRPSLEIYWSILSRNKHVVRAAANGGESVLVKDIVVVNKYGGGNFTTINQAIAAAPIISDPSEGYFLIHVKAGVYEEYVSVPSNIKYLFVLGEGIGRTIVTGDRSATDGWSTFNSATFAVSGQGFMGVGMTFRNTAGPSKGQAVALRSGADMSTFYQCSIEGYQDTLYTHSQRQFFRQCDIYGTVDFIFGNAAVVFQNCNIYPRLPLTGQFDPITAQGRTNPVQTTGISIHNCAIKSVDILGTTRIFLGRPWKLYSRTVYMQSFIDYLVDPAGWSIWSGDYALNTLYYAEFNNNGPGSDIRLRVKWPGYHVIGANDATHFTVSNFLLGDEWLPRTVVPYTGGLL